MILKSDETNLRISMAFQIINSIISWFLRKRKHQIELFIKYPIDVQDELLLRLLNTAKNTEFGKEKNFASIKNHSDFVANVPIQKYETFEPLIERCRRGEQNLFWPSDIKWFAKSSGTTNAKSKFIPVSDDALEYCHMKAGKDMLCWYIHDNEDTQLFTGKGLRLGGSSEVYQDNGSYFGDLSAIIIENMPFWADFSSAPSQEVALMSNWETKMDAIIDETIDENITSLAGVPSWMLVLLNRVLERSGKEHILEVWPNLEVYFHGGVNFNPYREQYKKMIPKASFKYYEIYNASEGFFAIQDRNDSKELLLMLDYGIFYEFIPMNDYAGESSKTITLADVKIDINYALIITTNAGLWRYLIGDTIRFTSLEPFRIKITGRTKHYINVFGEELNIENVEDALKLACEKTAATILDYTVGPIFMQGKEKGGHEWIIEFNEKPDSIGYFAEVLDNGLKSINSDYEAKRYLNITLMAPKVHQAREDLFYCWLKKKNKLGGQHKVPRLSNTREFVEELLEL
jgi:hypothetical protein